MIVTPLTISSIADMTAQIERDYLARVKYDVRYRKDERRTRLTAAVEGRRDAMALIGAGFVVETNGYALFETLTVDLGNAADGRKGSQQRRQSARAVKDKKVLIAKLFRSHLEDFSKSLVEGKEKAGLATITMRVARNPRVLVKFVDVLPEEVDAPDGPRCKVVKRVVRQAPRVIEYSLECQR